MKHKIGIAVIAALSIYGCQQQSETAVTEAAPQAMAESPAATEVAAAESKPAVSGINMMNFDTDVRPQDDLYHYVSGTWLKETEIPADKSNYGSFIILNDEAQENLRKLVLEVSEAENVKPGSAAQKIRDYYNTYMNTDAADEAGIEAIQAELEKVASISSHADLYRVAAELNVYGVDFPIGSFIFSDFNDPNTNVVHIFHAGTTLPDRDYYLEESDQFNRGRQLYLDYAAKVLESTGAENASEKAQTLLALETRLAEIQWPKEKNRDPVARNNPKSMEELLAFTPDLDWSTYLETIGVEGRDRYLVYQPSFFEALGGIVNDISLDTWKDYMTFKTVSAFAPVLSQELFQTWFEFARKGLSGVPEPQPRWKRAINSLNGNMGELLGQLYVERHFPPEAKGRMNVMVDNLKAAYRKSITNLDWMSDSTKQQALEKLSKFSTKIGYPDNWRDYSNMQIVGDNLLANVKSSAEFEYRRQLAKLDHAVDKTEWFMTPQQVNAYYNPRWNEIVFPAAILQPPFFNFDADDAVNYGGIGAVIGHEIGHGFDDQGRKSDGDGNLRDWWTAEDNEKFEIRKAKLAAQYDAFEVIDGLSINGEFTSGENIGDLGGLSIAYKAYKMSLNGEEAPVIDGLTGDQRFFMGWAQVWARLYRDEELKNRLTTDPHSPSIARANQVVKNIPAFYSAFNVQEGDGMYLPPEERVQIW